MRFLILGINFSPELTGIGKYSGEMAEWLAARGHEVRVVTAPPYYPEWRVDSGYSSWRYQVERASPGLAVKDVWRCPLWVPSAPGGVKRLLHLGSFAFSSAPIVTARAFWRPDLVMAVAPTLLTAPAALLASRIARAILASHPGF